MNIRQFLLLFGCLSLYGCPAGYAVKFTADAAKENYLHEKSGMIFPATVDNFSRDIVFLFFDGGKSVSAVYRLLSSSMPINVYVGVIPLPSGFSKVDSRVTDPAQICDGEFAAIKESMSGYPPSAFRYERRINSPVGHPPTFGWVISHRWENMIGGKMQPVNETEYVYCPVGGKWMIKYSFVWPVDQDGSAIAEDFMRHLPWTIR